MSRNAAPMALRCLRWHRILPHASDALSRRCFSQLTHDLRLLVSAITPEDQQLAINLIDSLKKLHGGSVSVTCIGDSLPSRGCSVLHPDVTSASLEPGEYVMRLPPPFAESRLHPEDAPLPNMRDYARKQSSLIVEAATMRPEPHAIVTVGSKFFHAQMVQGLKTAANKHNIVLPPLVQYTAPDLWDFKIRPKAAAVWRSKMDYVLCAHPFEPALLQSEQCGAAFTGHSLTGPLIKRARAAGVWMASYLQQQPELLSVRSSGDELAAFCSRYGLPFREQQQLQQQEQQQSRGAGMAAAAGGAWQAPAALGKRQEQAAQPQRGVAAALLRDGTSSSMGGSIRDPVVVLLPGQHEADLKQLIPMYDAALRQLLLKFPNLKALLLATPFWKHSLQDAAGSFGAPTAVVDAEREGLLALSAADVALCHPGPASLQCAAAGLPLVAVSPLNAVWDLWPVLKMRLGRAELRHASLPNLLLGEPAVPEVMMLMPAAAASQAAVEAERLLEQPELRAQQRAALQRVMLALLPPSPHGQLMSQEEVAASLVLEVVRQHALERQRKTAVA